MKLIAFISLFFAALTSSAEPRWINIQSTSGNGDIPVYINDRADAIATVVLIPGGPFTVGKKDPQTGKPDGINFLVRSIDAFSSQKLNVVLMDKPALAGDLRWGNNRQSEGHGKDVLAVAEKAKELNKPVWLVGTSLGAISVGKASLLEQKELIAGVVFSSSVFHAKGGSGVMTMDFSTLKIPVLISHHQKDECAETAPTFVKEFAGKFSAASTVEVSMIDSGNAPKGNVCGPWHWHGFVNAELETVKSISQFIAKNTK